MFALFLKFKKRYGQHFGLSGKSLWHTLALFGLITANVAMAFLIALANSLFNNLVGVISLPGVTYTAFFMAAFQFIGVILIYAAAASLTYTLASWLGRSLGREKTKALWKRWLTNKSAFLAKFIKTDENLNHSQVIVQDTTNSAQSAARLLASVLMVFFNGLLGLYGLWVLSSTLTLVVFGQVWLIPGYMALAAIVYSVAYNGIMKIFGKKLKKNESELQQINGEIEQQLHHIDTFSEHVAIREGSEVEMQYLEKADQKRAKKFRLHFFVNTGLDFLRTIHQQIGFAMGLLLSAPQVIAQKLSVAQIFEVSQYFSYVVGLFTWYHDNYEAVTEVQVGIDRISKFEDLLAQCEDLNQNKETTVEYLPQNTEITFNNLCLQTPNKKTCAQFSDLHIPRGSRVKITGQSGVGKSTLIRMLGGVWPFGSGKISIPAKKEAVLSFCQETYFSKNATLWDAIIYPVVENEDLSGKKAQAKEWMQKLKIKQDHIDNLDTIQEWGKILSGGEKQRIALLSILIHRPEIVFIDEGLSALDQELADQALQLLQATLPETTFICVDHMAQRAFYTHELILTQDQEPELKVMSNIPALKLVA
jgi:putative ATP-binding cassette transporter